jgi:iron complex transport system substrate-binding protein
VTGGALAATLAVLLSIGAVPGLVAAPAPAIPLQIRDAAGRRVQVVVPPRRVISLAPSVTEILLAIGVDQELVGISDADDYPPDRVAGRTRVGGIIVNIEKVVLLQPDLVIGVHSLQREQLERLARAGLPVLALDASSLAETVAQVRLLGRVMGRQDQARHLAAGLERRAAAVRAGSGHSVYIEAWHEPVTAAGGGTLIDDLVRRAGGVNVFAKTRGYPQVAAERVVAQDPQVILMIYPGRAQLIRRPGWTGIAAVRAGRVYEVAASLVSRPGPRAVEGLELVARLLRASP